MVGRHCGKLIYVVTYCDNIYLLYIPYTTYLVNQVHLWEGVHFHSDAGRDYRGLFTDFSTGCSEMCIFKTHGPLPKAPKRAGCHTYVEAFEMRTLKPSPDCQASGFQINVALAWGEREENACIIFKLGAGVQNVAFTHGTITLWQSVYNLSKDMNR